MSCAGCDLCPLEDAATTAQQIHVTVAACDVGRFSEACALIGTKLLVIRNILPDGSTTREYITSSVCRGTDDQARAEMTRVAEQLSSRAYRVLRQKIESAPGHALVPSRHNALRLRANQYFECHLSVTTESAHATTTLKDFAARRRLALSYNWLKFGHTETSPVTMATLRSHIGTIESFWERVRESAEALRARDLVVSRTIVEFSRYDSNVAHDAAWMG